MKNPAGSMQNCLPLFTAVLFVLTAAGQPACAQDEITVAKDTMRISVGARECYFQERGCAAGDTLWFSRIEYELNGPLPSGSQLWVEFAPPGKKPLKLDCAAEEVSRQEGRWKAACGGAMGSPAEYAVVYKGPVPTGLVPFTIGLRNELVETNTTLFTGKMKVAKYLVNPKDPSTAQYYVDDDWRIPIGYLYLADRGLHVITWFHGRPGGVKTYLFYQGKEIAKNEGCGVGDERDFDPTRHDWWVVDCELVGVYGDEKTAEAGYDPHYALSKNPGEYESKEIAGGHLARSVKFTVAEGGSFDNGIAAANKLGSGRVIVPVRVIGDQSPWDKLAWKTGAFYGNPLTGFTPPQ